MKIRFTRDYGVKDAEAKQYVAGDVVTVSKASAMHFVNRGAAVIVDGAEPQTAMLESSEKAVKPRGRPRHAADSGT